MSKHLKDIERHRAAIAALRAQRAEIADAPTSRDDIADELRQRLEKAAADGGRRLRWQLAAGELDDLFRVPVAASADLTPMLAAVLGVDGMMRQMQPYVAALPEGGLSHADRARRLREIDAELLAVEHSEQDAIDAAEAAGVAVDYRADASPSVVLRVAVQS